MTSCLSAAAFLVDAVAWYHADRIDIDPENSASKAKSIEDGKNLPAVCNENEALNGDHTQKINGS